MKKKNILRKTADFNRIIETKTPNFFKYYIIYVEELEDNGYYFGITVGKKLGKAHDRNKLKRQIKSILQKKNYQKNFNCIIMVKKAIVDQSYQVKKQELENALLKLNLIKNEMIEENK